MAEGSYRYQGEPAYTVIRALGGVRVTAKKIGVTPETVSLWNRPPEQRGYGGYIPERYWSYILDVAQAEKKDKIVTKRLLRSGERKYIDMANASRQKGDRFERQIVDELRDAGFDAHRIPLSGACPGFVGDVEVRDGALGRWVIQCKIGGRDAINQGGRLNVARMLGLVTIGAVHAQGSELIAMRSREFIGLLRGERPTVINLPSIKVPGKQICDELVDHDALLFRRTGVRGWQAVVTLERFNK
jgi:Holliday junction resolvase